MVRFKERYLLVNILQPQGDASTTKKPDKPVPDILIYNRPTTDHVTPQSLLRAIRAQVAMLFGDYGSGAVDRSLQVKYLSLATSTFILRISRAHYRLVWAALTTMDELPARNGKPCTFRVVRVSGTIRKIEEEAVRRAKQIMLAAEEEMAGKKSASDDALGALFGKSGGPSAGEFDAMDVDSSASEGEPEDGG
ncbi:Ribonuclease P/MRP protein subunit POP5 [Coniochaeta hoffmannii]|uniref:Ribonuclease P/MRP protein subunit POP5 n=1 Tax=Coniochaeta hoffmannii TaxID=91930 RepID=A0AA38RZZ8_9PEZI|nr:Ribonuclease P/MRP protein subunit POP5 [Coniochaeta hoffmannii]